jgi:2-keto-4-pentenoate hydratase
MIILTGGITEAVHVSSGDFISVEFEQLGTLLIEAI